MFQIYPYLQLWDYHYWCKSFYFFVDLGDKGTTEVCTEAKICYNSMKVFIYESGLLLVKRVQLVVDQPQLLGVRHLMLLLGVRLTRLLHALAARHLDRFQRIFQRCARMVRYRSSLAEAQNSKIRGGIGTGSSLSNRNGVHARACICPYDILIGTVGAWTARKPR